MTLSIMVYCYTQQNIFRVSPKHRYSECRFTDCRGTTVIEATVVWHESLSSADSADSAVINFSPVSHIFVVFVTF